MSDTPRTDAAMWSETGFPAGCVTTAEFARELERELSELRKHTDAMAEGLQIVLTATERWNEAVTKVLGRHPDTGIETQEPYLAIQNYHTKFPKP